jgi:hypothetical protein
LDPFTQARQSLSVSLLSSIVLLAASHVVLLVDEEVATIRLRCAFDAQQKFAFSVLATTVCECSLEGKEAGAYLKFFSVKDIFYYDVHKCQNYQLSVISFVI